MNSERFNEEFRFGSAAWADQHQLSAAGLFKPAGLPLGYFKNRMMRLDSDAPMITIAGAGSGKTRDLLGYVMCTTAHMPMMILDPRGELSAISLHTLAPAGTYGYFWNPMGICDLPQHSCNPLDILDPNSPNFHTDLRFIIEGLIPLPPGAKESYFILRARDWVENIAKSRVERNGSISLPELYTLINLIETDTDKWADELAVMFKSRFETVQRTAGEMLAKQQDAPREFGSVMGEVYAHFAFLNDPALQRALERSDFSIDCLVNPSRVARVSLNVPAEYLGVWSPIVRIFFTVAMLVKSRRPEAKRVTLICDEAGQLGRFEALLRAFTYGRGAGLRTWALFQDVGQISRNFEAAAVQGFLGSAQVRQFFGVRDYETAQLVSNMLGHQTLLYDDEKAQADARKRKGDALRKAFETGDAFSQAHDYQHYERASKMRSKQSRLIMTPSEVLSMPDDRQIAFISGKNLNPVFGWKYPYYMRRELAGKYLPNPYHPPTDKVLIKTRLGTKWVNVHEGPVPYRYADYPQYHSGRAVWVEGFPF